MLLGDFNSIYIGDTPIDAVYIGSNLVWSSNPSSGWSSNIFDTLTFTGGWLDTNGVVQHQKLENYGTSDFFECGNNTKVRVSFIPQYSDERGVVVCAYDENKTFISSPIYASMKPPYTLEEKEFIGEIPSGTKYLRYSYLWGKYNSRVPSDLNTVIQLGK